MFLTGLRKVATSFALIDPEVYEHEVGIRDPLIGALVGGKAGALTGALKGKPGHKLKAAVLGEIAGNVAGGAAGQGVRKYKEWRARNLKRYSHDLNLRATPRYRHLGEE
jgi:uncharacterized protein YcfJ